MKIEIEKQWLETLLKISKKAEKDLDKWNYSESELIPSSVHSLIGYASSTEIILKRNNETYKNKIQS